MRLASEPRPRGVRREGGQRGVHLRRRAIVARHDRERRDPRRASVRHHAAGRDHPVEPRRIDDVVRRQVAEVVARRRHDEDAELVERVDGVGPGLRRQPTHAHRDDVHAGVRIRPEAMDVVEGPSDRAVLEQDHRVGHADRHHVEERRAAERRPVDAGRRRGSRACPSRGRDSSAARTSGRSHRPAGRRRRSSSGDRGAGDRGLVT